MELDPSLESYTLYEIANINELKSHADKQIAQVYHAIEFGNPDAIVLNKLVKHLRKNLRLRRRMKNLECFKNSGCSPKSLSKMQKEQDKWPDKATDFIKSL